MIWRIVPFFCILRWSLGFTDLTESQVSLVISKARSVVRSAKPSALRLTFHDCVGGCDGCLDITDPDNAGLEGLVADLESVYQAEGFGSFISRADMWALMGIWAINQTIIDNNDDCADGTHTNSACQTVPDLQVTFQWGREDCPSAPYSTGHVGLPAGTLNYVGLMDFFSKEFGFSTREVTALMGAHTLGNAEISNSGFHGTWVNNEQAYFSNQYYANIVDDTISWNARQRNCASLGVDDCEDGETTGWQWTAARIGFNLNPDMALYKEFDISTEGEPSCSFSQCPSSATATVVEEYAQSNTVWVDDFSLVFAKMLEHGYRGLNDVSP